MRRPTAGSHPRVEHAPLRPARECGLNAADSRIERIGDRDVLLVRRFDREWTGTGYHRHRMASALTLLRADDTPTDRGRWSCLALADELRRASASPREDLRELFARMCFNAAVSNLDDHPRNHALLAGGRDWRLSPAYDLTPMRVIAAERRDLATVNRSTLRQTMRSPPCLLFPRCPYSRNSGRYLGFDHATLRALDDRDLVSALQVHS